MTKAFDTALFVPGPAPQTDQGVDVAASGPPFATEWDYLVKAPGPGVTVGSSIPAAIAPEQTLRSGPAPGFPWEAVPPYYLGALTTQPVATQAPGTMYFNTIEKTPYIWNSTVWIALPTATAPRLTVAASLPAATGQGQMLVAGPGPTFPWQAAIGYFIGAHPSAPTQAPDGSPIPVGGFYYDTTTGQVYVWSGTDWKSIQAPSKAVTASLYYEAVQGQTIFDMTTNDLFGQNHTFNPTILEGVEVLLNGVRLTPNGGSTPGDYTIDFTTSVLTLSQAAALASIVCIDIIIPATASSDGGSFLPLTGGTLTGDLNVMSSFVQFFVGDPTYSSGFGVVTGSAVGSAILQLKKVSGVENAIIANSTSGGQDLWKMNFGNATPESGANAGSDFDLIPYSDASVALPTALHIERATGDATFARDVMANRSVLSHGGIGCDNASPSLQLFSPTVAPAAAQIDILGVHGDTFAGWQMEFSNGGVPRSGANAGADFSLIPYGDNNSPLPTALHIERATGIVNFAVPPTVAGVPMAVAADIMALRAEVASLKAQLEAMAKQ